MTKLTTERLENIATWREKYGNGANVMIPAEEAELMARQLLAYEQAAEKPYGYLEPYDFPRTTATLYPEKDRYAVMPIYAAPVLPKQPEHSRQHFESLCNQFLNWAELDEIDQDEEPRLEWNGSNYTHRVTAALWKMYQAAPAQPVIPEQPDAQDLELYIDMLENSDSDDQDGELNNTQLIMWLKELQRRRTLPAQPANGDKQ